jgi:hypothetical protein
MSRVFSFRDLQLIPELSEYNEIELLHPSMDDLVNSFLSQLGFNIHQSVLYVPALHRDMQGNVGVGFRAVGSITTSREFLNSKLCSPIERLIAASTYDMSLTKELSKLMGSSVSLFTRADGEDPDFPEELVEPDCEDISNQIAMLEALRDDIRGTPYNEWGALKTPEEYKVAA